MLPRGMFWHGSKLSSLWMRSNQYSYDDKAIILLWKHSSFHLEVKPFYKFLQQTVRKLSFWLVTLFWICPGKVAQIIIEVNAQELRNRMVFQFCRCSKTRPYTSLLLFRYFTWDASKFPNSKAMIKKVASKGRKVRIILITILFIQ